MTIRLQPGDRAPAFTLTNDRGEKVKLTDLRGQQVIVYFYPAALTPGCTKQACDFSDRIEDLAAEGLTVVGISPDPVEKLARFRAKEDLRIELLADPDKKVATKYGAFGEKKLYGRVVEGIIRSTFVIGPTGRIELAQYNVRATGHVAKLRRDLGLD